MTRPTYAASIFWSVEDEGFIALAPDLPGCSAFGETQAGALRELQHAISAWLEAAKKADMSVPDSSHQFSGRVLVRLPRTLHAELANRATFEGVSLNQYIVTLLAGRNAAAKKPGARRSRMDLNRLSSEDLAEMAKSQPLALQKRTPAGLLRKSSVRKPTSGRQ